MTLAGGLSAWVPVIAWAGLIFGLSSIPSLTTGWGLWDFILRKLAHMAEYGILMILLVRAFSQTWVLPARKLLGWCAALTVLYAVSDEFHQTFVPGRTGSVADVLIDSCGALLVLLVYRRIRHFQKLGFPI